jgi:hypothetical protein
VKALLQSGLFDQDPREKEEDDLFRDIIKEMQEKSFCTLKSSCAAKRFPR